MNEIEEKAMKMVKMYGTTLQLNQMQEECAELIVAINHWRRDRVKTREEEVIEEIADVYFLLKQMTIIFGVAESELEGIILDKLR